MPEISLQDELSCARRCLRIRRERYPGLVRDGRYTQAWADHQVACQEAIVRRLESLLEQEAGQQMRSVEKEPA